MIASPFKSVYPEVKNVPAALETANVTPTALTPSTIEYPLLAPPMVTLPLFDILIKPFPPAPKIRPYPELVCMTASPTTS